MIATSIIYIGIVEAEINWPITFKIIILIKIQSFFRLSSTLSLFTSSCKYLRYSSHHKFRCERQGRHPKHYCNHITSVSAEKSFETFLLPSQFCHFDKAGWCLTFICDAKTS